MGKVAISYLVADPKFHVLTKVEEQTSGANGADVIELAGQGSLYVRIMVSKQKFQYNGLFLCPINM